MATEGPFPRTRVKNEPYPIQPRQHPLQIQVYEMVRPNPAAANTGYHTDAPVTEIDDEGVARTAPSDFTLPAAPAGQAFTSKVLTASRVDRAGNTVVDSFTVGDRPQQPYRCTTTIQPAGVVATDHFSQGTVPIGGNALNLSERPAERLQLAIVDLAAHDNPTLGGMPQWNPHRIAFGGAAWDPLLKFCGVPLFYRADGDASMGVPFHFEIGQVPADFSGDPDVQDISYHGEDATKVGIWWQSRFWWRITRGRNPGGEHHPFLQVDRWNFVRPHFRNGVRARNFAYWVDLSMAYTGRFFDKAYVYDAKWGVLVELLNFVPVNLGTSAPDLANGERVASWLFARSWRSEINHNPTVNSSISYPNSGYLAVILRRTADDFTVAVAGKLAQLDHEPDALVAHRLHRRHGQMSLKSSVFTNMPQNYAANQVLHIDFQSKAIAREPGWVGARAWLWSGLWADVQLDLRDLYLKGTMEQTPAMDLPKAVIAGTEFPPNSWRRNGGRRG